MDLGLGEMGNERSDQHGRLSLADERRSGSDDSLSTRDAHGPEKEHRELSDEPLQDAPVVQKLYKGHEEDDGRENAEEEEGLVGNLGGRQEFGTLPGEAQKLTCKLRDEGEDVVSSLGPQNKQGDDELDQHANNDGVPYDLLPVAGSSPEAEQEDDETEQTDSTVRTGVILGLFADERSDDDDSNGQQSASRNTNILRDVAYEANSSVVPDPVHRPGDDGDGHIEEDQTKHDGEPEQEGNNPVLIMAMLDDGRNPPSTKL